MAHSTIAHVHVFWQKPPHRGARYGITASVTTITRFNSWKAIPPLAGLLLRQVARPKIRRLAEVQMVVDFLVWL